MFIYCIVCSETLKIYIGQHKGPNLDWYLVRKFWDANHHTAGTRSRLYASMRKHPRESWSIHSILRSVTREDLDYWERHFIRVLKTQHPDVGYNICDGGEGFSGPHSEKSKKWISRRMKKIMIGNDHGKGNAGAQYPKSPEWRAQVSAKMNGQKKTAEHAQHIGDGHRGLVYNLGNSWNVGRKASDETRRRMSEAQKRRQAK